MARTQVPLSPLSHYRPIKQWHKVISLTAWQVKREVVRAKSISPEGCLTNCAVSAVWFSTALDDEPPRHVKASFYSLMLLLGQGQTS